MPFCLIWTEFSQTQPKSTQPAGKRYSTNSCRPTPRGPAPEKFLEAAQQLDVKPDRSVVVEDAVSGVQAGRRGGFGLVVGVARKGDADALRENGADIVVTDLMELVA